MESAVVSPSDEDSNTFSVNSWNGECYKLRAVDARARQDWVNRLRATAEYHSQVFNIFKSNWPVLFKILIFFCLKKSVQKYSKTDNVYDFCPSGVKRSLANARQYLSQAENNFIDMARVIEKLPSQG